jgi:hypothetical protein
MSETFVLVLALDLWRRGASLFIQPSADAMPLQDNATFKDPRKRNVQRSRTSTRTRTRTI